MLWYVIQTYTGREEKLVKMMDRIVPRELYGECFVAYHEQLRCRKQENQVHVERIFPGYAFITSEKPEELFFHLKKVPAMSKMMTSGEFVFVPLEKEETQFLDSILDGDHVVRLSYAATNGRGHVSYLSGPLERCGGRILEYRFRQRYASVRLTVAGQDKEVRMGIILNDDIRREVTYGRIEALIETPGRYVPILSHEDLAGSGGVQEKKEPAVLEPGDSVAVIEGAFEGNIAVIDQVKKNAVRISVHLFGRDISAEVPVESVRKTA